MRRRLTSRARFWMLIGRGHNQGVAIMNPRRLRPALAGLVVAVCLAAAAPAAAVPQNQVSAFSFDGVVGTAFATFTEFDPADGTLDTVSVSIDGTFTVQVLLQPFTSLTPIIEFDVDGAGGRGFDFAGDGGRFILPVQANPTGTPIAVTLATGFSAGFTLTALTDLTGVIVPSFDATIADAIPPTTVEAQRSDFIQGIVPIGISETLILRAVNFTPLTAFSGGGAMVLTYNFEPAAIAIPAPSALALLASGLAVLAWRRRVAARSP